ncbi:MAG: hypothetical protein LBV72_03975 [Tannerella sp.]|jgi:predicted acyltransferase (DUF342 family)|nr:hypothetical protein [Tannerella sp.]
MDLSVTAVIITILGTIVAGIVVFLPGWFELRRPKDDAPLYIDEEYQVSPFFIGDSFYNLLESILPKSLPRGKSRHVLSLPLATGDNLYKVPESGNETVVDVVSGDHICPEGLSHQADDMFCVYGDLYSGTDTRLLKEAYVQGSASLGENSRLSSMFCGGNLTLDKNSSVAGWIDVRGIDFFAGEGCTLGYKTACKGNMRLSRNTTFFHVFAVPLRTYSTRSLRASSARDNFVLPELLLHKERRLETSAGDAGYRKTGRGIVIKDNVVVYSNIVSDGHVVIGENCEIRGSVIAHKGLLIKAHARVLGDVKSRRDICMEENAVVFGHVLADGKIVLRKDCEVQGNIFSQRDITINSGCIVGRRGTTRSVVARDIITLHSDVAIYGRLSCLRGMVV